jgi:hypothetical protein
MGNNKKTNIVPILLVFTLGMATFNQFDFEKFEFENPALSIVYIIGFATSIYLLVKKIKINQKNKIKPLIKYKNNSLNSSKHEHCSPQQL